MHLIDTKILEFYKLSCENIDFEQFFEKGSYLYNWENIRKLLPSTKGKLIELILLPN